MMTIDPAIQAEILRLFHAEGWPIGTIARQLKLHYSSVKRVVRQPDEARPTPVRPTMIDEHRPFILETLAQWPTLKSRRVFDMCVDRGYRGSPGHFRDLLRTMRPEPSRNTEAFLRLHTTPGEQGQVDWGHFGMLTVGRARRQLLAFVMVLSWSRMIFVRFFIGGAMPSFLQGHVEALDFFGGTPRTLLYDNLKSAVLERKGDAIRFHPTMLELATHYSFRPRPVGIRKGNEKGRVERAIRFIRDSFFGGRTWTDIDDLNRQASDWMIGRAAERPWPDDTTRTVGDAFAEERSKLRPLPGDPFPAEFVDSVKISKTPYARFEGNDYTVPHEYVRRTLTIAVTETQVRLLDGIEVIAEHERCYDKGQRIEQDEHVAALRSEKLRAKHNSRPADRLYRSAPSTRKLVETAGERGENLGSITSHLLRLLDQYGGRRLDTATRTAVQRSTPHPRSVQLILEVDEQRRGELPAVPVALPNDPRVRGVAVRLHGLASYDSLRPSESEPEIEDSRGDQLDSREAADGQ